MNENTINNMKEEIVNILNEPRDWQEAEKIKPDEDQLVVIRITNPDRVCYEDDTRIYHLEDILMAQWKDNEWRIEPPFHKYNYSPLTDRYDLKPGTIVTHWAVPEDGEVESWHDKLSYFHEYKNLSVIVDPEREETVYRALMWGAAFIEEAFTGTKDPDNAAELREFFETLKDLQYSIDQTASSEIRGEC